MARVKHIGGWISVVLLVVTLTSIWILTEQNVEQTSSLSESTARVVEGRAADVRPDAAQESQAGDAVEGAGSTTATVHPDPLAPVRLWMGANIRRVAHTVEFFFCRTVCFGDSGMPGRVPAMRAIPVRTRCALLRRLLCR